MDIALIQTTPEEAQLRAKEYERALSRRADPEYATIAQCYWALAEGTPLIQLSRIFADVPRDHRHRPSLAIARADRPRVKYCGWTGVDRFNADYESHRGRGINHGVIEVPNSQVHRPDDGYALVPIIPPAARGRRNLTRHFVLWEVERWADERRNVGPDIDPYLLKHVTRDIYAVVAAWDLMPLEQAVLAGRREL